MYHEELYSLTLTNLTNHYAIKPQRYCKARCAKRPVMFIVPFCRRDTAVACVSWRCDRHITLTAMSLVASHSCWRQCSSDTAPATHLHTSSATSSSSVIQTGILLPRWSRHPSLSCCPSPRPLRSANRNCLAVPRCRLSTYGCRAFDYARPTVWNSLPGELRNSDSFVDSFKWFMKTILFSRYSRY